MARKLYSHMMPSSCDVMFTNSFNTFGNTSVSSWSLVIVSNTSGTIG